MKYKNDIEIKSILDFKKIVNNLQNDRIPFLHNGNYRELYRGHSKNSYTLRPWIARFDLQKNKLIQLEIKLIELFIKDFDKKQKNTNPNYFEYNWRIIEQMQHFRLPTRLLDWSISPYIALFFAVSSNFENTGQFWVFKSPLNWQTDNHFKINPFSNKLNIITSSSFEFANNSKLNIPERRRFYQEGKFTCQDLNTCLIPLENQPFDTIKYIIKPPTKRLLLDFLNVKGINKDNIYGKPDEKTEVKIKHIKNKISNLFQLKI